MIRLYVLVEGPTEEAFVNDVLGPHLGPSVTTIPIIVTSRRERSGKKRKGGGHWKHWGKDLRTLTRGNPGDDVRFTTLFDLYGLPSDFPEIERHAHEKNTLLRAIALEKAMADVVGDWRLIPYLQRHEFEALVLASLDKLSDLLQTRGGATLRAGAIVATVGAEFEVLFQLTGPVESRVRVELYHPTHEVALEGLALDERFSVSAAPPPRAAEAESGESPKEHVSKDVAKETHEAAPNRAWLQEFTDPGVREVFAHLEAHGVVTEDEAARMLGGPRALRRFSNNFESYVKKAPFLARIDTVGGVKRYVREGQK